MDEARVEATGLVALRDELARIHGLNDKAALPALFAHLARLWVRTPSAGFMSNATFRWPARTGPTR
jgi:hypothetical protein